MSNFKNIGLIFTFSFICLLMFGEKPIYSKHTFKVWGNCEMCKTLIEKTVKSIEGVKTVNWNEINGKMKVKFNAEKTNIEIIQKAIANVGYDTDMYNASDEAYNNLHYCCKYERK